MKHIDKVFKDKLYHQKAEVPEGMWEKIAPALEEESGRGLLWFWFAGILAIILTGMAYYFLSGDITDPRNPLAIQESIEEVVPQQESNSALLTMNETSNEIAVEKAPITEEKIIAKTIAEKSTPSIKTSTKAKKSTASQKVISKSNSVVASQKPILKNSTSEISTFNTEGKPANLKVTKSYISDNGAVVKHSTLGNTQKENSPEYNVFINSEGLNAGALLRIIEPVKSIPLPAFEAPVKKKLTKSHL